jgi:hypothetical protein
MHRTAECRDSPIVQARRIKVLVLPGESDNDPGDGRPFYFVVADSKTP